MLHIAALFVDPVIGPYGKFPCVDLWDKERDARLYQGPYPIVAHPPCERWGRYWSGGPSAKEKRVLGDDNGCFNAAFYLVRRWGGVIEHPEGSHAWNYFGIDKPSRGKGWIRCSIGGYTCSVDQGHYGHRARKSTWLYVCRIDWRDLPKLDWSTCRGKVRMDDGFHSTAERRRLRTLGIPPIDRLSREERIATPMQFASVLLSIATKCSSTHI